MEVRVSETAIILTTVSFRRVDCDQETSFKVTGSVESLLSSPNTKVALVSFADGVTAHLDGRFVGSDEKQELLNEINGLTANGGTFTQAAIRQARRLLEEASDADHKVIVLLSDGEPTYSYRIRTINDLETYVLAEWYWDWDGVLHMQRRNKRSLR
jgi:hypothetical protein